LSRLITELELALDVRLINGEWFKADKKGWPQRALDSVEKSRIRWYFRLWFLVYRTTWRLNLPLHRLHLAMLRLQVGRTKN
jgi:hypothetical protein